MLYFFRYFYFYSGNIFRPGYYKKDFVKVPGNRNAYMLNISLLVIIINWIKPDFTNLNKALKSENFVFIQVLAALLLVSHKVRPSQTSYFSL
jgi:hypothetical protein